ncbi:hypothetical protein AK812_SmicGene1538 [Symbiodinium microadriaticum]|uniref:Uncharacterized protein n=1 Tax=Symbiodinium microadriaticum TaxID=2951 RepID=A0A1Q9F400_SYMMI|nr:hypothetical protein AK812_SmicGene1538 [Symbiodinium microadriaticum]
MFDGAVCWATTWPTCVAQCLHWWEPVECTQCWLTNYTANCLGKYSKCLEPGTEDAESSLSPVASTETSTAPAEVVV